MQAGNTELGFRKKKSKAVQKTWRDVLFQSLNLLINNNIDFSLISLKNCTWSRVHGHFRAKSSSGLQVVREKNTMIGIRLCLHALKIWTNSSKNSLKVDVTISLVENQKNFWLLFHWGYNVLQQWSALNSPRARLFIAGSNMCRWMTVCSYQIFGFSLRISNTMIRKSHFEISFIIYTFWPNWKLI